MQVGGREGLAGQQAVVRRRVWAFLLYANLPVGLIAVAFLLGTYALLMLPPSPPLLLLGFCGTFLVYQGERVLGFAPEDRFNQPERLAWIRRHRGYVRISSLLAAGGGLLALSALRVETIGVCAALGGVSVLYMVPLLPGGRRLKEVWFLKPLLIGGGWAVGGVLLPVIEAGAPLTHTVGGLVLYRFLFVLPNALFADWPDRAGDARAGLSTAATRLSTGALRRLSTGLLLAAVLAGLGAAAGYGHSLLLPLLLIDLCGPALMLALLLRPPAERRWVYGFLLDALVAWPVVTYAAALVLGR